MKKQVVEYQSALSKIIEGKKGVVGFAFAINGEMNNADVYCDPDLFQTLWPKLLKSAIVEALSEYDKSKIKKSPVNIEAVKDMLEKPHFLGKESVKEVNKNTKIKSIENDDYLFFETNAKDKKQWIHRNYIKKGPEQKELKRQPQQPLQQINTTGFQGIQQLQNQQIQIIPQQNQQIKK